MYIIRSTVSWSSTYTSILQYHHPYYMHAYCSIALSRIQVKSTQIHIIIQLVVWCILCIYCVCNAHSNASIIRINEYIINCGECTQCLIHKFIIIWNIIRMHTQHTQRTHTARTHTEPNHIVVVSAFCFYFIQKLKLCSLCVEHTKKATK